MRENVRSGAGLRTSAVFHDDVNVDDGKVYDSVTAARGTVRGDEFNIKFFKLRGPVRVIGTVVTRIDMDERGHARALLEREEDGHWVAGCMFSEHPDEEDRYYLVGPLTEEALQRGYEMTRGSGLRVDLVLLNACGMAPVQEL